MLNKAMIIGRLGRDPEIRENINSSSVIGTLNVATDESFTDRSGNRQERTEWHRVVVFQKTADLCRKYLHKGSLVYVEGSLQTRKWTDQQGVERYTTEIRAQRVVFLDKRSESDQYGDDSYGSRQPREQRDYGRQGNYHGNRPQKNFNNEDLGPAFPSEASGMDDVPF